MSNVSAAPRAAVRGSGITLLGQGMTFIVQMASLVILARILSPADYGVFAMAFILVGIASVFSDMGLSLASVRDVKITSEAKTNLFWINLGIGTLLAAGLVGLGPAVGNYYGEPKVVEVVQVLAAVLLLSAFSSQSRAEMSRTLRFRVQTVIDVSAQVLGLAVALITALSGMGYWALVWQQMTIFGVTGVSLFVFAQWLPSFPKWRVSVKKYVLFGLNTSGLQAINYLSNNLDAALVGRYFGVASLGFYNRATQVFRLPIQQVASPLSRVAIPVLSRVYGSSEFERFAMTSQLILAYSLVPLYALLAGLADPLIGLVLGESWTYVVPILQILCVGGLFQAVGYVYYWIFVAADKTGLQLRWGLVARLVMVILVIVGAQFDVLFVAAGVSIGLFTVWLLLTIFVLPTAGIRRRRAVVGLIRPVLLAFTLFVGAFALASTTANDWISIGGALAWTLLVVGASMLLPWYRRDFGLIVRTLSQAR